MFRCCSASFPSSFIVLLDILSQLVQFHLVNMMNRLLVTRCNEWVLILAIVQNHELPSTFCTCSGCGRRICMRLVSLFIKLTSRNALTGRVCRTSSPLSKYNGRHCIQYKSTMERVVITRKSEWESS